MNIILNPQYGIRNEAECSYLCLLDNSRDILINVRPLFLMIPPLYGYILSSFTGNSLEETVQNIHDTTQLKKDKILKFVNKLIDNDSLMEVIFRGVKVIFPPKILQTNDIINIKNKMKVVTTDGFNPFNRFIPSRPSMPLTINFMITSRCKTDCIYCYADRNLKVDFGLEKILTLLDECYQNGVLKVGLSGGDIFAYKDWEKVIERMYSYGYSSFISTKIPLDSTSISFLSKHGIREIQFSLDSVLNEELDILVRPGKEYVKKVEEMLKTCKESKIKVDIKTVITKYNSKISSLKQLYKLLVKYDSVHTWNVLSAFYSHYKDGYDDYRGSDESLKECYRYLKQLTHHSHIYILCGNLKNKITTPISKFKNADEFVTQNKGCVITTFSMSVNVFGQVVLCEMLYNHKAFHLGNTDEKTIKEIWQSETMKNFHNFKISEFKVNENSPCYSCSDYERCKIGNTKKICIVDIITSYGEDKWDFPDPRCPKAPKCNMDLLLASPLTAYEVG